jgi:hypothetical protein
MVGPAAGQPPPRWSRPPPRWGCAAKSCRSHAARSCRSGQVVGLLVPPSEAAITAATMERKDAPPRGGGPPPPRRKRWRLPSTMSTAPWEGGRGGRVRGDEVTAPAAMRRLQGRGGPSCAMRSTAPWEGGGGGGARGTRPRCRPPHTRSSRHTQDPASTCRIEAGTAR